MKVKDPRMKGMPWVSSYLIVSDVEASIDFYQKAFGLQVTGDLVKNEEGKATHCELKYQDGIVMIGAPPNLEECAKPPAVSSVESPISLYIYVEDVDAFCQKAKENGAIVLTEPEDTFWGDRMCRLKDLNGYIWSFSTHLGEG